MTDDKWAFEQPKNAACLATKSVFDGGPILRVYHDFDGGWQFHGADDESSEPENAKVVSLGLMVRRDPSLLQLADLPDGWMARRASVTRPWRRSVNHPFPTFRKHGFYLEDAAWLATFFADIRLPAARALKKLRAGDYVKLVFRFADENAARMDGQCERMWVRIESNDDDEAVFTGTLDNDPHHTGSIACGDRVSFHASHIVEILPD